MLASNLQHHRQRSTSHNKLDDILHYIHSEREREREREKGRERGGDYLYQVDLDIELLDMRSCEQSNYQNIVVWHKPLISIFQLLVLLLLFHLNPEK